MSSVLSVSTLLIRSYFESYFQLVGSVLQDQAMIGSFLSQSASKLATNRLIIQSTSLSSPNFPCSFLSRTYSSNSLWQCSFPSRLMKQKLQWKACSSCSMQVCFFILFWWWERHLMESFPRNCPISMKIWGILAFLSTNRQQWSTRKKWQWIYYAMVQCSKASCCFVYFLLGAGAVIILIML